MATATELGVRVSNRATLALRGRVSGSPEWYKAKWASAYFAGLIDGEGCIQVRHVSWRYPRNPAHKPSFCLAVSLSMSDPSPPYLAAGWLTRGRGRSSRQRRVVLKRDGRGENRRDMYQVTFSGKHAACFLRRIFPFLVVKRFQAWLGLRFYQGWQGERKGDLVFGERYNRLLKAAKKRSV